MTPQAKIKARLLELAGAVPMEITVTHRNGVFYATLRGDHEPANRLLRRPFPESYMTSSSPFDVTYRVLPQSAIENMLRPMEVDPACLAWNDSTVVRLAQSIRDALGFARLPILADALEEAGCGNADLLQHCRAAEPHFQSCWLIDLLLGTARKARR